ncbi:hypothetical protein BDB00DRAFT_874660 [Zychaea mexicana]|uniref:uncharacterized protein n=1 Tax=Zychaea mexicana TaxID=64656 RepID=UPI0022FDDCDD|nr:uncharacterized protein BDB00DRAFT_874660 [Zychaea mexicana]KAI9491126.1 hypothetical protein BDB00DRAFT_874660 [Zychaea mexicana]
MLQPTSSAQSSANSSSSIQQQQTLESSRWRPLPSVLIDFMAITLCDIIPFRNQRRPSSSLSKRRNSSAPGSPTQQPIDQQQQKQPRRPVPELVYFIQKITHQAGINCRTALVALIYLERAKKSLPRNSVGSYDTCHRMLLGALLLASKFLQDTAWAPTYTHSNAVSTADSALLAASWARYYGYANSYYVGPITNRRLCDMCGGLFSLEDINMLERAFLKLIKYQCWVDEKDVHDYVERHRVDLAL